MVKNRITISLILLVAIIGTLAYLILFRPTPFSMQVIPEQIKGDTIPGQRFVFLVTISDEGEGFGKGKAVSISANVVGSAVTIYPQAITPVQVVEVTVVPDATSAGENLTVTIRGERDGLEQTKSITFSVFEGEDTIGPYAVALRDKFVTWLATNHPELGITNETEWTGTIVSPVWLVVSHYLFFSDEWEMHVSWHIMIAPYDWARIDLRHRITEVSPSRAFEISSVSENVEPQEIEPPETVWR